jgi:hypothetical protein
LFFGGEEMRSKTVLFVIALLYAASVYADENNTTDPYVFCAEQYDACLIKCESVVSEDSSCQDGCEKAYEQCLERADKKVQEGN